jgi:uncharacterized protein (TIGR02466 family)
MPRRQRGSGALIEREHWPDPAGSGAGLGIKVLFPTLLGETEFPDSASLNRDLAAYIRARERRDHDHSRFTTVNHGWQSAPDIFDADLPAIHVLKEFIDHHIEAFLQEWGRVSFSPSAPGTFRYSYAGWAVILRRGGFQHEHIHTKTDLIGVYYVDVPAGSADESRGSLTFIDPRTGRLASRAIWEYPQYSSHPKPGKLVLFPSFVPHRVDQVLASGERLSINFDVTVQAIA